MDGLSTETREEMKSAAKSVSRHAYCPYSQFPVGTAVPSGGGEILAGCNVENASYGLTICAERNAILQAVAHAMVPIRAVVIYTPTKRPLTLCGACRQVIKEFGPDAEIFAYCDGPETIRERRSFPRHSGRRTSSEVP